MNPTMNQQQGSQQQPQQQQQQQQPQLQQSRGFVPRNHRGRGYHRQYNNQSNGGQTYQHKQPMNGQPFRNYGQNRNSHGGYSNANSNMPQLTNPLNGSVTNNPVQFTIPTSPMFEENGLLPSPLMDPTTNGRTHWQGMVSPTTTNNIHSTVSEQTIDSLLTTENGTNLVYSQLQFPPLPTYYPLNPSFSTTYYLNPSYYQAIPNYATSYFHQSQVVPAGFAGPIYPYTQNLPMFGNNQIMCANCRNPAVIQQDMATMTEQIGQVE